MKEWVSELNVARRHATKWFVALMVTAVALAAVPPGLAHAKVIPAPLGLLGLFGGLALFGVAIFSHVRATRFVRGTIRVDAKAVRLGADEIPKDEIVSAWFGPSTRREPAAVNLMGKGDVLLGRIAVRDKLEGDRILDALGLGSTQRAARFDGFALKGSLAQIATLVCIALGIVPAIAMFALEMPVLLFLSAVIWIVGAAVFNPCKMHVGADGLLVATRIAPTFISWGDVERIEPIAAGVRLFKKDGTTDIHVVPPTKAEQDQFRVQVQGFFLRVRDAHAEYRAGGTPSVAAMVARGGRDHADWLRELFDRDREGSFRTAPLPDEQLWNVVESPSAEPTARAGAAAILARTAGDAERARFRIAANECTAPKLRVVLEQTASGATTEEVEAALAEVEDEGEREAR